MQSTASNIALAKALPPRLIRFFMANPPRAVAETGLAAPPKIEQLLPDGSNIHRAYLNPFQAHKHPRTGRWHPPIYSLRQQADLVKLARAHGVEDLLPYTVKNTEVRAMRREEHGLRVKGTGVGQRVKGHEWERTLKGRLEKRRQAMLDMPRLVQEWKQRGHGRGVSKWPSGKAGKP